MAQSDINFSRIEIMLGWACNNNCIFCAESWNRKDSIKRKLFIVEPEIIKKQLIDWYNRGANHVTFLGGEPTINKNIFNYLRLAKEIGYKTIFMATNARMCSNEEFTKKLVEYGLNETSVSLHGYDDKSHDQATRVKGAFNQTFSGLKNLVKYCDKVMINMIINQYNYNKLDKIIDLIKDLKLIRILISYPIMIGNAHDNQNLIPSYNNVYKYINKAIDRINNQIKITVMNVPFCYLQKFDKYSDYIGYANRKIISPLGEGTAINETEKNHTKSNACENCKYDLICPGVHKSYVNIRGYTEFKPASGEKIKEIKL